MAEQLKHHEHGQEKHEELVSKEHGDHAEKARHAAAEKAKKERSEVNLATLREHAKAEAKASKALETPQDEEPDTPIGTQNSLKKQAYAQSLKRIQQRLPAADKVLSKIVHNKAVDAISSTSAQTVARPSGLLGGSICAFAGSLILLYSAKHYGFRYNYLVFILCFLGGFAIGLILELLIWALYGRKKHF